MSVIGVAYIFHMLWFVFDFAFDVFGFFFYGHAVILTYVVGLLRLFMAQLEKSSHFTFLRINYVSYLWYFHFFLCLKFWFT